MGATTVESREEAKARGGFYTPAAVARFLVRWAVRSPVDRVLEPSCGDGAFVAAIDERFRELGGVASADHLLAVEREPHEAAKARSLAPAADIRGVDFFDLDPGEIAPVDAVIGNPPYIRYHGFAGSDREKAMRRTRAQGVELSGLASSWAHFTVHGAAFLQPEGRLALVLPAELLHADYAEPVRAFLLRRFSSVLIVAFDRMVFQDAQVDAILLLASSDRPHGLSVRRVSDVAALAELSVDEGEGGTWTNGRWSSAVDSLAGQVYQEAVEEHGAGRLGDIASVDIGFVTGANDFFVLSSEEARARGLPPDVLTPAVRRPQDVPGLQVRVEELSWLLDLHGVNRLGAAVQRYLEEGERDGIARRYKCRVRRPWYVVPLPRRRPHAFLPYMSHLGPRLIANEVGAWSTNLLHGVTLRDDAPPLRALAVAMCSSLTLLSGEIEGRAYGGGVLKLETREAERLVLPKVTPQAIPVLASLFDHADLLMRKRDEKGAAALVDRVLGVDHERVWQACLAFRERRLGRKRSAGAPFQDGHSRPT